MKAVQVSPRLCPVWLKDDKETIFATTRLFGSVKRGLSGAPALFCW